MSFLTVEEVVAASATITGSPTREERMIYSMWVWIAERQIRSYKLSTKTAELPVVDCVARKPLDYISIQDIALIDSKGNDIVFNYKGFNKRIHPITSVNNPSKLEIYEDEHCFHISNVSPFSGLDIDCVHIRYSGMPIDEEGNLMIPESHLQAIMRYIKYMDGERNNYPESKMERLQRQWHIQAQKARGADQMPNSLEARSILSKWMTHIPQSNDLKYNSY